MRIMADNQTAKAASQQAVAKEAPAPRTLIINEGMPVKDIDTLRLVVCAILESDRLEEEGETVVQAVQASGNSVLSHDQIPVLLRRAVEDRIRTNPGYLQKGLEMLTKISKHELLTAKNRTAFSPETKPNPRSVMWPNPTHAKYPSSVFGEKIFARKFKFIDRSTPIGSAGSCFAFRIAQNLQREGYNYVITEPNPSPEPGLHNSCARWGVIFNVPSFRQLVERAFGLRKMPRLLWTSNHSGAPKLYDPFREDVEWDKVEDYEADYDKHTLAAREAFLKCKVFVMTLGMNEVWYLKAGNVALARAPWNIAGSLVESRVLTVEENVYHLQRMLDLWRSFNPDLKIIVTTSPVPLHATFRGSDYHVIAANAHSKSTLRLAAEAFAERNRDVFYFPAYETVIYGTERPWEADQRHVSEEAVRNVMSLFGEIFLTDDDWTARPAKPKG